MAVFMGLQYVAAHKWHSYVSYTLAAEMIIA